MAFIDEVKKYWNSFSDEAKQRYLGGHEDDFIFEPLMSYRLNHDTGYRVTENDIDDLASFFNQEISNTPVGRALIEAGGSNKKKTERLLRNVESGIRYHAEPSAIRKLALDYGVEVDNWMNDSLTKMPVTKNLVDEMVKIIKAKPDETRRILNAINRSYHRNEPHVGVTIQEERDALKRLLDHTVAIVKDPELAKHPDAEERDKAIDNAISEALSSTTYGAFASIQKEVLKQIGQNPELQDENRFYGVSKSLMGHKNRKTLLDEAEAHLERNRDLGAPSMRIEPLVSGVQGGKVKPEDVVQLMDKFPEQFEDIFNAATNSDSHFLYGKVPLRHSESMKQMYDERTASAYMDYSQSNNRPTDDDHMKQKDRYFMRLFRNPTYHLDSEDVAHIISKPYYDETNSPAKWRNRVTEDGREFLNDFADLISDIHKHRATDLFDATMPTLRELGKKVNDTTLNSLFDNFEKKHGKAALGIFNNESANMSHYASNIISSLARINPQKAAQVIDSMEGVPQAAGFKSASYADRVASKFTTVNDISGAPEEDKGAFFSPEILNQVKNKKFLLDLAGLGSPRVHMIDPFHPSVDPQIRKETEDFVFNKMLEAGILDPSGNDSLNTIAESFMGYNSNARDHYKMAADANVVDRYMATNGKSSKVEVKRRSETLRYLRDYLESLGSDGKGNPVAVDPKELPKNKTWNSILTASMQDKDGKKVVSHAIDWNPLRDPKRGGKVTAESVQKYIDKMKPTVFHAMQTYWDGPQRHNDDPSDVIVFGATDDHIRQMKDAGVYGSFMHASRNLPSSHPQHPLAIGWARYTSGPNGKFLDEIQSDLGKALKNVPAEHAAKINDILFEGSHPSEVLHEAFHQYARQNGWVGQKLAIHSTDSKRWISLNSPKADLPVHFVRNYEDFPSKRLNAEPGKYGEDADHETGDKVKGQRIWRTVFRKMEDYSDWEDI